MMDEKDKRIKELEEEVKCLKEEKEKIEQEKKRIEDAKKHIEREFEEFKAKHAGTVQNLRKALKIKSDLPRSPNPIGAKPHHKGHGRKTPTHVDEEKHLIPDVCPHCSTRL